MLFAYVLERFSMFVAYVLEKSIIFADTKNK